MTLAVAITDPLARQRKREPIVFSVAANLRKPLWWARDEAGNRVLYQRLTRDTRAGEMRFIATVSFSGQLRLALEEPCKPNSANIPGIKVLKGKEADCFVRLDTGAFDLELCSGSAQGLGSSKWGIRHFRSLVDDFELLPSGNNAIGGFYGPFFAPENGLINPPEHTTVEIETLERGPVLHHYRMHGTIPDGLLDELKGKRFSIDWIFTHGTPFFQRRYQVDPFQTVINGCSVTNKITVGDEFEGGKGQAGLRPLRRLWRDALPRGGPLCRRARGHGGRHGGRFDQPEPEI